MCLMTKVASLLSLIAPLSFATILSGPLVDAKCYASLLNNTGPDSTYVDRDFGGMIRCCAPKARTTCFAVVQQGGIPLSLDPHGNVEAAELVKRVGGKKIIVVNIAGQRASKRTLKVTQLSMVRTIRTSGS